MVSATATAALDALWAALFPARCIGGCGRRGVALCDGCRAALPYLDETACARCALPGRGDRPCRGCRHLAPSLVAVRAVCAYEGAAQAAVRALKFRSGQYLGPVLAELLVEAATRRPLAADLVIPVPLAPGRARERGYNQARLLAGGVPEAVGGALAPDLLAREDRPAQRTLSAAERRANLVGAFWCPDPAAVAGRRILLLDDVLTTGATLSACAGALAAAGAARVSGLVFARTCSVPLAA